MKNIIQPAAKLIFKNWKTSVVGLASLVVGGLIHTGKVSPESGATVTALLAGMLGVASKDSNVSGNAGSN